jgi:hypothetical protein
MLAGHLQFWNIAFVQFMLRLGQLGGRAEYS